MAATILICADLPADLHGVRHGSGAVRMVMLINCALGLNTPPVGTTQFVGCAIGGVSIGYVMRTIWPFYGADRSVDARHLCAGVLAVAAQGVRLPRGMT
jgi:TRAP-type C4-dicarboxylate transport system permease large subunit